MKNKPLQILILTIFLGIPQVAMAAEATLPIRASIVQCGPRAELRQACDRDSRCCGLMPLATEAETAQADEPAPVHTMEVAYTDAVQE